MQTNDRNASTVSATILLVDDEDIILEPMSELLENFSYRVICADNGKNAINAIKEISEIDVVVLDVLMPDMDGIQTLYQIRTLRPQVPIILASGYNYLDHIGDIEENDWNDFIQKPYDIKNLILKIRSVLGA